VAVVELKGGHVEVDAIEQLQQGAKIVESLTSVTARYFAAILVTNRAPHAVDLKVFNQGIRYAGKRYPIQIVKCGGEVLAASPWGNFHK
jgi:hypothetical protein